MLTSKLEPNTYTQNFTDYTFKNLPIIFISFTHHHLLVLYYSILQLQIKIRTYIYIKTHDSESRGQEEAGRTRRMSVLFTGSTALKFVNALNKPPLKLSLSYQRLSTF